MGVFLLFVIVVILWAIYRALVPSPRERARQAKYEIELMKIQHPELYESRGKKSIWEKDITELFRPKKHSRRMRGKRDEKGRFIKS